MVQFVASIDTEWIDFTKKHEEIRKYFENPVDDFSSGKNQDLFALWGPYGQGKTQLMYHLFKHAWKNNVFALFTTLDELLPENEMRGSSKFLEYIKNLVDESIEKIKEDEIDQVGLLNSECKNWLKKWVKENQIKENLENRAIIFIDEMEQNYSSLLDKVKTDDNSPLRACTNQNKFMVISAFAPTSQYEALTGEAEKRRWHSYRLPTLSAKSLREINAKYGNFAWWVSKGRLGLAYKILDFFQTQQLNKFTDFEDFANKDIGKIANVPSIDTSELAKYIDIKKYVIELYPHTELKTEKGIVSGKIITEDNFINILKNCLKEEDWDEKDIEFFSDYFRYTIIALSNNNKEFLVPQENDGSDPTRILTLLKFTVDFAIEIEGRTETVISLYNRIHEWKNYEQFYYTKLFPKITSIDTIDGHGISYDLLPKLFPLPITSPIIGEKSIEISREKILTNHQLTAYMAEDIEAVSDGQIRFFYFINNQKLQQFLASTEINNFLPPDRGLVCIVLEDKEEIKLEGVAGWLKTQNRIKVEYPSKLLRDFLISFVDYYQLFHNNEEDFRGILQEKIKDESKKDKTLSRKIDYYLSLQIEFIKFSSNLALNREKFDVADKQTIKQYSSRYDKFSDIVGLSFCRINELTTFHNFKQIIMGSDELKELRAGVSGPLKDISVSKKKGGIIKLSKTLDTIKNSYTSELGELTALVNLVDGDEFIKLSSDDDSKKTLRGIFKSIKSPNYDKTSIAHEINNVIRSINKLKTDREDVNNIFDGFEINGSKSERTEEKWNAILAILNELTGGYLEFIICHFTSAVLDKFKDDILNNDQNGLTEWQNYKQYVESYNENFGKIDDLKYVEKWLKTPKMKLKIEFQNKYSEIIKDLTNHQSEIDFNAVETLNWDNFNEELSNINDRLSQIIEIEDKLEEIVEIANEINTILGGRKYDQLSN